MKHVKGLPGWAKTGVGKVKKPNPKGMARIRKAVGVPPSGKTTMGAMMNAAMSDPG